MDTATTEIYTYGTPPSLPDDPPTSGALRLAERRRVAAAALLRIVFDRHELQHHLPTARLSFEPWPGRSPFSVAGAKHIAGENRTPRIPEAIMTPLLSWSLRYVTCYAGDILAARAEQIGRAHV